MKQFKSLVILLVVTLLFTQVVYAAEYISKRSDGKGVFEYQVTPGLVIKDNISFKNLIDSDVVLSLETMGASMADQLTMSIDEASYTAGDWEFTGAGAFVPNDGVVSSWIELDEYEVIVPAGEEYLLPFKLVVPDDAEEYTTYFGGIKSQVKSVNDPMLESSGSTIRTAKVDRVYVHVLSDEHKEEVLVANEGKVVQISLLLVVGLIILLLLLGGGTHHTVKKRKKKKKTQKKKK